MGLSVRGAVVTIYGAGVVLGGAALLMSQLGSSARIVGVVGLLLTAAAVAVPLARVRVYSELPSPGSAGDDGHQRPAAEGTEAEEPASDETGTDMSVIGEPGGTALPRRHPLGGTLAQPARRGSEQTSRRT